MTKEREPIFDALESGEILKWYDADTTPMTRKTENGSYESACLLIVTIEGRYVIGQFSYTPKGIGDEEGKHEEAGFFQDEDGSMYRLHESEFLAWAELPHI